MGRFRQGRCSRRLGLGLQLGSGFRWGTKGLDHRVNMFGIQRRRSQEFNKSRTEEGRAVVNQVGFLAPAGQIEIVSTAMVGK